LIYHPGGLEYHVVACPDARKARLKAIFANDHRVLKQSNAIWALEPIRRNFDDFGTVLYIDSRSRLPRLIDSLGAQDVAVEGVWPIQTLIERSPPCDCDDHGFISVINVGQRFLVSSVGASGARLLAFKENDLEGVITDINAALAFFEGAALPGGLLVCDGEEAAAKLRRSIHEHASIPMTEASLADWMSGALALSPGSFSDFTPRKPLLRIKPDGAQVAALLGLIATALALVWFVETSARRKIALTQTAAENGQREALEQTIREKRSTQSRIEQMTRELSSLSVAAQPLGAFLMALSKVTPPTIALENLSVDGSRFSLRGRAYRSGGDAGPSPLELFCRELGSAGTEWQLQDPPPPRHETPNGNRAGAPTGKDTPAESTPTPFLLHGQFVPGHPAATPSREVS
jgi:hypothetical protein